jgi:nitrogen-specific signal transduction histidine kinase/CheY-like chemotaxis protein
MPKGNSSIWALRDVSDLRALEKQLRQSQKMEALGRLAGGIAHDFNNLLQIVYSHCDDLRETESLSKGVDDGIQEILGAATQAASLIHQLLAFSKGQVLQPRHVDPNALLRKIGFLLSRTMGEHIELQLQLNTKAFIRIDPHQFEQVILNLALNGRDAMPRGGVLTLKTRNCEIAAGESSLEAGRYVAIEVCDTGVGMTETVQPKIFEPYYTTKKNGTGLGLSIAYGIIRQSGGILQAHSRPQEGSTLEILLPAVQVVEPDQTPPNPEQAATGSERILLVENDPAVRRSLVQGLSCFGYKVTAVASCREALEHTDESFAVLVSDIMMPETSGFELVHRWRQNRPEQKAMFVTGYFSDATGKQEFPDVPLLRKPFTGQELAQQIRRLLDAPPSQEEPAGAAPPPSAPAPRS